MNLIDLMYDSTHYYLVQCNNGWIMVDTGWAGTMPKLFALLKQKDINVKNIKFLVITHFHPDHAGLAQELKDCGARLILHEIQVPFVSELKKYFKPEHKFKDIEAKDNIVMSSAESRGFLAKIGINGEIIPTPGHSDDSVSLIIDECCAFTGDLSRLAAGDMDSDSKINESWKRILDYKVKKIYPAHGMAFNL